MTAAGLPGPDRSPSRSWAFVARPVLSAGSSHVHRRPAFTLFELVLVMAILVMLAAVATPTLDSLYGTFRVTAAADSIRAAWADARTHAMNEGCAYRFSVV